MTGKSPGPQCGRNKEKFLLTAEGSHLDGVSFCIRWSPPYEGEHCNLLVFPYIYQDIYLIRISVLVCSSVLIHFNIIMDGNLTEN